METVFLYGGFIGCCKDSWLHILGLEFEFIQFGGENFTTGKIKMTGAQTGSQLYLLLDWLTNSTACQCAMPGLGKAQ